MNFEEVACEDGNCESWASFCLQKGTVADFDRTREARKRLTISWLAPAHVLEELNDDEEVM